MSRFAIIYKQDFNRTKSMSVDAESREAIKMDFDPQTTFVEHVIDFDERKIYSVAMKGDGTLIEVPEGDFGEATPGEYFEEMAEVTDGD